MRNRHEVLRLAREAGLPLTKQLRCFGSDGRLRVLEVERPTAELAEELRSRGLLPGPGRA